MKRAFPPIVVLVRLPANIAKNKHNHVPCHNQKGTLREEQLNMHPLHVVLLTLCKMGKINVNAFTSARLLKMRV